jgi:2-methylisocitrate lyase-like PEP mutase family enzyme
VLYAPTLDRPEDLRELLAAVDLPANVLARRATPPMAELVEMGVKRISVSRGFAFAAYDHRREGCARRSPSEDVGNHVTARHPGPSAKCR